MCPYTRNSIRELMRCCTRTLICSSVVLIAPLHASWATPAGTDPIWRAQLHVKVCDVKDAKTDDAVYAELNDNNRTWLNYARNDFERNNEFTYDLVLNGVRSIADIRRLKIGKTGDNGLCIKTIRLAINNRNIFDRAFDNQWLDGSNKFITISRTSLEADEKWSAYRQPMPPLRVTANELESRLEAMMGTVMHDLKVREGKLKWNKHGSEAVTLKRKDRNTLRGDLDLKIDINNYFDQDLDLDFDLDFGCSNGALTITMKNFNAKVDSRWYAEVATLGLANVVDAAVEIGIESSLRQIQVTAGNPRVCPDINVMSDGTVVFSVS